MTCLAGGHIKATGLLSEGHPARSFCTPTYGLTGASFGAGPRAQQIMRDPGACWEDAGGSLPRSLSSCQAVDSLINTWEEKCQSRGQFSGHLGMGPPPDQRVTDCGCHLCRFHYVVTAPALVSAARRNTTPETSVHIWAQPL